MLISENRSLREICFFTRTECAQISKIYEIAASSAAAGKTRGNRHLINWKLAQDQLNRKAVDCRHKYQSLLNAKLKKGPFEKEEVSLFVST